jgi:hypothetical protein
MSLRFVMEETILLSLSLLLVSVPVFCLAISFALILPLGHVLSSSLHRLLSLLATALLLYIKDLLALALVLMLLTLISIVSLCVSAAPLLLFVLVLLIQPSTKVII